MESLLKAAENFVRISSGAGCGWGCGDGTGDGSGYGDGSGCNDGDGFGNGSGDGWGNGAGCGWSNGSGNGFGDGWGKGYGWGAGDIDGDGLGCGDGSGILAFNGSRVYNIDDVQTLITHVRGNVAKGFILRGDLTTTPCYIAKSGNLFAHGETLREAQEALRDKLFHAMTEDERIDAFCEEFKLNTFYTAAQFFDWHNKLTGSCLMGREAFARSHGYDVTKLDDYKLTVQEFVELTKDSYGGDIIRKVAERLGIV